MHGFRGGKRGKVRLCWVKGEEEGRDIMVWRGAAA